MGRRSPEEIALLAKWREEAVVLDLYEGGSWNPDHAVSWLRDQGPDVWHELALKFNWGSPGVEPLRAVVEHPTCDRATVMSVFALAAPDSYEAQSAERAQDWGEIGGLDRDIVDMLDVICRSFSSGYYKTSLYSCAEDPEYWGTYYRKRKQQGKPIRWNLPDRAFQPTEGRRHNPNFILEHDKFLIPFERWSKASS